MAKKRKNKYNHYTEDFRREAVRRSEDPNTSAAEVAKELGIHPGQIYNWRPSCPVALLNPCNIPSFAPTYTTPERAVWVDLKVE